MVDWTDKTWRSLQELAEIAFPPEAGVTAGSLQRRARRGLLVVYRPGKFYISNLANVWDMIQACQVKPTPKPKLATVDWRVPQQPPPDPFGRTEAEVSRDRLEARLARWKADHEEDKRKRAEERAAKMAERKLRTKERRRAKAREVYREKKAKQAEQNDR